MGYKAVADIKVGHKEYIERGQEVTESDVEDLDALIAAETVVTDERYEQMFPEAIEGANQPSNTPSNLEQIEGTELQADLPEVDEETGGVAPGAEVPVVNPADPPVIER